MCSYRLHDNPALLSALEPLGTGDKSRPELRAVFVLDPWFVKNARVGPNRWKFLHESLKDLDESLRKIGSRLFVIRGKPNEVFERIFKVQGVVTIILLIGRVFQLMGKDGA